MISRFSKRGHDEGFTLIELIVSVAIFTLISTAAYLFMGNVLISRDRSEIVATQLNALQKALLIMQRDFEQIANRPARDTFGDVQPAILAQAQDRIEFSRLGKTIMPFTQDPQSEVERVRYHVEEGKLLRSHWSAPDQADQVTPVELDLLQEVTDFEVRYLYSNEYVKQQWTNLWPPTPEETSLMPEAIEVNLELKRYGKIRRLFRVVGQRP